ncbi:MAG: hypothetical protein A2176_01855 [Spirochaetes bacterium RBG_13_51_14]|nr:MAG: hypothetical protein A2176_01855 [Spirochaetes bacterium RBG_13_51_14]
MKKILLAPILLLDSLLDRICALLAALTLAQFPQYLAQYLQRLGGHVDEAARNIEKYREVAKEVGKTLEQYVQHLLASKDLAVFRTGQKIGADIERYDQLAGALKDLTSAPAYKKLFIFITNVDWDIARATWERFTPGLPLTLEGAIYAAAGIVIGMTAYFCVSRLIVLIVKKIAARDREPVTPPVSYN